MAKLPRVLVITDEATCRRRGRSVVASVARMLSSSSRAAGALDLAGQVAVVVRHKQHDTAGLCEALRPICHRAGALVFAHGDTGLVGALGLDGVHLPGGASVRAARLRLPRGALLGQSRHAHDVDSTGDGADDANNDDVDYVTLSPIFSPSSKPDDTRMPLGVGALRAPRDRLRRLRSPVFALGGVDDRNARACLQHGAVGVAVIGAVLGALDPRRALLALLDVTAPSHTRSGRSVRGAA